MRRWFLIALAALSVLACTPYIIDNRDDDDQGEDPVFSALAATNYAGGSLSFTLDNGKVLTAKENKTTGYEPVDGARVFIYFRTQTSLLSEKADIVLLEVYPEVLIGQTVFLNSAAGDDVSLYGSREDKVEITASISHFTAKYLNVFMEIGMNDPAKHRLTLVRDEGLTDAESTLADFYLFHDDGGENATRLQKYWVCFPIDGCQELFQQKEGVTINYVSRAFGPQAFKLQYGRGSQF